MKVRSSPCNIFQSDKTKMLILYVMLVSILFVISTSLVRSQISLGATPKTIVVQRITTVAQEPLPGEEWLEPGIAAKVSNFLYSAYDYLRKLIVYMLEQTIFKGQPGLATFYGDAATFLASITALYILISLVTMARRVVMVVLIIGWVLFVVSILIRARVPT